ncbi:hypothetical protein ABT104_12375 [Streptomyces mobaraensis]|uniref:hypothetical protein n=1 Tax=Streptomyces mobaraensis TaxID=35621 RepID=UPI00331CD74E
MVQAYRKLLVGAAFALSLTACTADGDGAAGHPSPSVEAFTPLRQLKPVDVGEGFPAPEESPTGSAKVVGTVRKGSHRLVAYTKEGVCGLVVSDAKEPYRPLIDITSAWPTTDTDGSGRYPAGPYGFVSGAGADGSGTWASLYCGKAAMVIDYSSQERAAATHRSGNVSAKEGRREASSLTVVIGSEEVREKVLRQV